MKEKEALTFEDRWAEAKAWYEDRIAGKIVPTLERWLEAMHRAADGMKQRFTRKRSAP